MPSDSPLTPRRIAATRLPRSLFNEEISDRYREILECAAALFAERGYLATSVRDIGERVGLLGGSLYHHIKSKDALFITIHDAALQAAGDLIEQEVAVATDPWQRLEIACIVLLEIQLDPNSLTMPLMNDFRAVPDEVRHHLVARRDAFEQIFVTLIAALPLDPALDRKLYRLLLLNLLNSVVAWYRKGPLSPADIGRQIVQIFRHEIALNETTAPRV